jgi:hypothetical protein
MHVSFLVPIVLTFLSRKTGNASFTQKKKQQQQQKQQQKQNKTQIKKKKMLS